MSTFEGMLKSEDLGPGVWVLVTAAGDRITLVGEVPASLSGRKVRVTGNAVEGGMGIGMAGGPMVEVSRVEAL